MHNCHAAASLTTAQDFSARCFSCWVKLFPGIYAGDAACTRSIHPWRSPLPGFPVEMRTGSMWRNNNTKRWSVPAGLSQCSKAKNQTPKSQVNAKSYCFVVNVIQLLNFCSSWLKFSFKMDNLRIVFAEDLIFYATPCPPLAETLTFRKSCRSWVCLCIRMSCWRCFRMLTQK